MNCLVLSYLFLAIISTAMSRTLCYLDMMGLPVCVDQRGNHIPMKVVEEVMPIQPLQMNTPLGPLLQQQIQPAVIPFPQPLQVLQAIPTSAAVTFTQDELILPLQTSISKPMPVSLANVPVAPSLPTFSSSATILQSKPSIALQVPPTPPAPLLMQTTPALPILPSPPPLPYQFQQQSVMALQSGGPQLMLQGGSPIVSPALSVISTSPVIQLQDQLQQVIPPLQQPPTIISPPAIVSPPSAPVLQASAPVLQTGTILQPVQPAPTPAVLQQTAVLSPSVDQSVPVVLAAPQASQKPASSNKLKISETQKLEYTKMTLGGGRKKRRIAS